MSKKYTVSEIADAIRQARGMISQAAVIAGCSRTTIYKYIRESTTVKEAFEDTREALGDRIEGTLQYLALGELNKNGVGYLREPSERSLIFLAKTHPAMRARGYAERHEIDGRLKTLNTNMNVQPPEDYDPGDILEQLAELGVIPPQPYEGVDDPEAE